jgi:hypothetical protein
MPNLRIILLGAGAAFALAGCETVDEEVTQALGSEISATLLPVGGGGGSGRALLAMNDTTNQVCADLEVSGIGDAVDAHVHAQDGTRYLDIAVEDDNDSDDCDTVSDALLDHMRRSPRSYYVDVHTAAMPNGALRGTLRHDRD